MSRMKKYIIVGAVFGLVASLLLWIAPQSNLIGFVLAPVFTLPGYITGIINLSLFGSTGVIDAPSPLGFTLFSSINVIFYALVGALVAWIVGKVGK